MTGDWPREPYPANLSWVHALTNVLGSDMRPSPRGKPIREVFANKSIIDMNQPVVTIAERELSYKFMVEEALWILTGRNNVFHKNVRPYSDNGCFMQGAYGPKVTEQMQYVIEKLGEDRDSRQAVINTWRESPRESRDIPCTLSMQFLIREMQLHMVVSMRSSDLMLGFPYDIFSFSMIARYVLLLGQYKKLIMRGTRLGGLYLTAGSSHLYEKDVPQAEECIRSKTTGSKFSMKLLYGWDHPDQLINCLEDMRDNQESRDRVIHG